MTHAKVLVVDGLWAVLGTTNIDNRSFEHNDEVNVALRDQAVAAGCSRTTSATSASDRSHARAMAAAAAVGEDRRPVRLDSGAAAVSEAKAAPSRRRPHRHLQHPPLPRHGPAHHRRRASPRCCATSTPTSSRCRK